MESLLLYLSLFLIFLTGWLLIQSISSRFSWSESLGFAFPVGLGLITLLMFVADWTGLGISGPVNAVLTLLLFLAALWLWAFRLKRHLALRAQAAALLHRRNWKPLLSGYNLAWLLLLLVIAYVEYSNVLKTVYFPTYDRDSMAGFDTMGFIAAQEGTYRHMSIFDGNYALHIHNPGSYITYMPMLQLAYAYVYSLVAATSKLIPALVYLGFLFGFYGSTKRATCRTAAMLATLGMMMSPEMLSFSSLSNTNVVHACVASAALIYYCLWFRQHRRRYLLLGSVLLALSCWIRIESLVFVGAAFLLVLLRALKTRHFRPLVLPLTALLPILLFTVYAHTGGLTAPSVIIAHPFWDGLKAESVLNGALFLLAKPYYYGWTFPLMFIAFLLNVRHLFLHGDNAHVLLAFFTALVLYFWGLYHINYVWDSLDHVLNYSAKRFLFCFVPVTWFYMATLRPVRQAGRWIEEKLTLLR